MFPAIGNIFIVRFTFQAIFFPIISKFASTIPQISARQELFRDYLEHHSYRPSHLAGAQTKNKYNQEHIGD